MPEVSFSGVLIVALVAFLAPFLLGLLPRLRLPAVVLEIVAGIVLGPSVLGLVRADLPIQILSVVGLAFLLFLSGLEVEVDRFRGPFLRSSASGLAVSILLALAAGGLLQAGGLAESGLFVSIVLLATSIGLVVPVVKDAGQSSSLFGQLAIAGAAVADFGAVILLSLFFSREATGAGARLVLLAGFVLVVAAVTVGIAGAGRSMRISDVFVRLQDSSAQLRVRGAVLLMIALAALAETLGLEVILGAFLAGAVLKLVDRDVLMSHPNFHPKLEALGFGFLIPVFFVTSGVTFDLPALLESPTAVLRVPAFLAALVVVRGLPAFLYRPLVGTRRAVAAGLLQATSLPFVVAATRIGVELGAIGEGTAAGLVAAGLLSVLVFPVLSLSILRDAPPEEGRTAAPEPGVRVPAGAPPPGGRS